MAKHLEHNHQAALFEWIEWMMIKDPRFAAIFAVPNGSYRHKWTAAKLKREGVRAGVPDIFVSVPSTVVNVNYPGMYIELKTGSNKPTELQLTWHRRLRLYGYLVVVCYGFEEAKRAILNYFGISDET